MIFYFQDEAWMDLEQSKDKGAPLFVDFGMLLNYYSSTYVMHPTV